MCEVWELATSGDLSRARLLTPERNLAYGPGQLRAGKPVTCGVMGGRMGLDKVEFELSPILALSFGNQTLGRGGIYSV